MKKPSLEDTVLGVISEQNIEELYGKGKLPGMKAHYEKKASETKKAAGNIAKSSRFMKPDSNAPRQVLSKFASAEDMENKAVRASKLMKKLDGEEIEEDLNSVMGHASPGLGPRHNPRKQIFNNSKGSLENRKWGGNQARAPQTYNVGQKLAEAKESVMKKLKKSDMKARGKTDTGQIAEPVELQPMKPELTTNH